MSSAHDALPIALSAAFVKPGRVGGAEFMARNLAQGFESLGVPLHLLAPAGWYASVATTTVQETAGSRFVTEARFGLAPGRRLAGTVFLNYFTPLWLSHSLGPTATVIHDLMYAHFPQFVAAKKRAWLYATHKLTLHRTRRVIAISAFVKQDILERYGSRWESKLRVVPNPISWTRFENAQETPRKLDTAGRVVLSVAAHWPHKNIGTLIEAFRLLRKQSSYHDVTLVLVGQRHAALVGGTTTAVAARSTDLAEEDAVVFTGHVDDAELAWYYRRATIFVLPSLFEGFGMPAVESLGLRLPTLITKLTSLPEVTLGLATEMEDPRDPVGMAALIAKMLDNPESYRPSQADADRIRLRYAPATIAQQYLDVLRD
jgi:glycosyltransferase involved in cell wall biosynthesis